MKRLLSCLSVAVFCTASAPALAEGDAASGEKVFRKCKACHEIGPEAKTKTGPVLNGILNAAVGRDADFDYSPAFEDAAANGMIWNEATLADFLRKPRDAMKGTKMSFAGLRKDSDIADLIAYLSTFD